MPDRNTSTRPARKCASCGRPDVVAKDGFGEPSCRSCRALELGGQDGQASATFEILEVLGAFLAETGLASPDDLILAFADAVGEGEKRRETGGLKPVPRFDETQEQIRALTASARADADDPEGAKVLARTAGRCGICDEPIVAFEEVIVLVDGEWCHDRCDKAEEED